MALAVHPGVETRSVQSAVQVCPPWESQAGDSCALFPDMFASWKNHNERLQAPVSRKSDSGSRT
eukprot:6486898-Pyramimonas_sp.AAC.1